MAQEIAQQIKSLSIKDAFIVPPKPLATPVIVVADLESGSLEPDAAIFTLSGVAVDVETGCILGERYWLVDHGGDNACRRIDADTMEFWERVKRQQPEAYTEAFDHSLPRLPLGCVMQEFCDWSREFYAPEQAVELLGNGVDFDNAVMAHACNQLGIEKSWAHYSNQQLHTMVWMHRLITGRDYKREIPFDGVPHISRDDARHEAKVVSRIIEDFYVMCSIAKEHGWTV
ncbi:MAG: hypothetical protein SAqTSB_38780 [Shewanella algae]